MALLSADSCSHSKFRTHNSRKSTLDNMRKHWRISNGLHDVLSKWCHALQQEVPQATKQYVHLQINQFELQVNRRRRRRKKHIWLRWVELGSAKKVPPGFHPLVKLSHIQVQWSERSVGIPRLNCRNVEGARVRANDRHEISHLQTAGEYLVQNLVDLC